MVERRHEPWGPRPGEDWRAHRMRVFADYPEHLELLRLAESRAHLAELWRARKMEHWQDYPEIVEELRHARFDLESSPEEDEEDIRAADEAWAWEQKWHGPRLPFAELLRLEGEEWPEDEERLAD